MTPQPTTPALSAIRRRGLGALRVVLAAIGGAATYLSFPPIGWWWTAPLGVALAVVAVMPWDSGPRPDPSSTYERHTQHHAGPLGAFGLGVVYGFVFFILLVFWVGTYVGSYAAFGLALIESLYLGLFAAGTSMMLRALHRSRLHVPAYLLTAVCIAAWWSAVEWLRSSWPWNGFPWGRLAFGQADGPLLHLVSVATTAGLSFLVALIGVSLAMFAAAWQWKHVPLASALRAPTWLAGCVLVLIVAATAFAISPANNGQHAPQGPEQFTVTAIQGNVPRMGLDFNAQRRAVLDNHVAVSLDYAQHVRDGELPAPDLVVWPENAADVNPLVDPAAGADVNATVAELGAPTLIGTVIATGTRENPSATNTMLLWDPERGDIDHHDKYYVQPFGEWLPWRPLWERLFPIARTAGYFVPGAHEFTVRDGDTIIGVATCFEIAFTDAARQAVTNGARILTVPTNNATFGYSDMTYQQLAMSQVQAAEHHIPVVVAATSGVSAIVDENGRVLAQTDIFTPGFLTETFGAVRTGTLATRLGSTVEYVLVAIGLLGAVGATNVVRRLPGFGQRTRPRTRHRKEDNE